MMKAFKSVDAVIKAAPKEMQPVLKKLRETIHKAASAAAKAKEDKPKMEEAIRYGMPTFRLNGKNLVYFMFFKKHIGFFAGRAGIEKSVKEAKAYMTGRSVLRFEADKPVPYGLVARITKLRIKEVLKR